MHRALTRILVITVVSGLIAERLESSLAQFVMPAPRLNSWIANFNPRASRLALKAYSPKLNEISLFAVGAHMDGSFAMETDFIEPALRSLRKMSPRPKVLLTVANIRARRMQDQWLIRHWLGGQDKWTRHAQDLVKLSRDVDGLDLDYENLTPDDGPRFTAFIEYLAPLLHARGKVLTVTVEHHLFAAGSIDWKRLSGSLDRVRIMAYQYHYEKTAPGSISPPDAVFRLAQLALARIPAEKIEISLPLYGFDWNMSGPARVVATTAAFEKLAARPGAVRSRDAGTQAARIQYQVSSVVKKHHKIERHEIWFEDAESLAYKVNVMRKLGIQHFGLWQLGAGDIDPLFKLVKFKPA
jgi:spore germination protein YaaH